MASRNIELAREAYRVGDVEASIKAHDAHKEKHKTGGDFIKSLIYGGFDGVITIFAIIAGAQGSNLGTAIIIILGVSGVVGDAFSMAVADYLSTKSTKDYNKGEKKREQWEVQNNPEGEKQEMIELYTRKGIAKADAERMVEILAKNEDTWVEVMMAEELGIIEGDESPIKNALVTFFSFVIFGMIPVIPYIIGHATHIAEEDTMKLFIASVVLTGVLLFLMGVIKTGVTGGNVIKAGLETLLVGAIAAGTAYGVGVAFAPLTEGAE